MRILKILGGGLAALLLLVALAFVAARFHDGPLGLIPGGALVAGEVVPEPVSDWSFADAIETIELQLSQDDNSRTTWILVREGHAYIPASLGFPPGKSWHLRADRDGEAVVRILGRRYPVTLERVNDPTLASALVPIARAKYGGGPSGDSGVWFFAVESRAPGG